MDEWTISSRTYAIDVGGGAVHAYIVIEDNSGRVIAEYHGFPYSRETGEYEGNNPLAFTPLSNFRLRPRRLAGESGMSREVARVHEDEVFRGPRSQVLQIQSAIDDAMMEIDRQDIDYGGGAFSVRVAEQQFGLRHVDASGQRRSAIDRRRADSDPRPVAAG